MSLRSLLDGNLKVSLITIEDTVECSGAPLMIQLIDKISVRMKVDIFCLDMNTELSNRSLNESRIAYHPIYKQFAINTTSLESTGNNCLHSEIDIFEIFKKSCLNEYECDNRVLIIDSLSLLLFNNGLVNTMKTLNEFLDYSCNVNKTFQLICFLHSDVHQERVIKAIEFLSQVIIRLKCGEIDFIETTIVHKKSKGVLKEVNYFKVADKIIQVFEEKHFSKKLFPENSQKIAEPTLSSKLTFNLSLNDTEKESRAKVILPYEKQKRATGEGSGNISYEFERDDDFDEDDPDDDLDF